MASTLQNVEAAVLSKIPGVDPRLAQRMQAMAGLNDGPGTTAARVMGLVQEEPAKDDSPLYTTNTGQVLHGHKGALNIGGYPVPSSDYALMEKQQAFNRSKIQERIVHPCGSSYTGRFTVTADISHLTKAAFLQPGTVTPCHTRFSTVTYGREYPDSARNPRGFATKFYTADGNYDLVGINWPIFFVRDPWQAPDLIRSQQRDPRSFKINYNGWFDFLANVPESNHAGLMLLSDHGTPVGWRYMSGFGVHTFTFVNAAGESNFVRFTWLSCQGTKNFTFDEATQMCGEDPDFAKSDLFDHIEGGGKVSWKLNIQVMTPEQASTVDFDPFDPTKVFPRDQFPLQEVGEMVLDRNVEDYHRDTEQLAFAPGSYVPGIQTSPDALLAHRNWFYRDAQIHRLGTANFHQIPVNSAFMATNLSPDNYAGQMRVDGNTLQKPTYFPNSYESKTPSTKTAPSFDQNVAEAPMQVASNVMSRMSHFRHEGSPSEYTQVRELYQRVLSEQERANLHSNTSRLLKLCDDIVIKNYLIQLYAIDSTYATAVYEGLPVKPKTFTLQDVAEKAPTAHLVGVNPSFQLENLGTNFMGMGVGPKSQYRTGAEGCPFKKRE